jgi:hypothetical protein
MRTIPNFEKKKRGCIHCYDAKRKMYGTSERVTCPYDECPYRVLDKYDTYEEFMKSEDSRIMVNSYFSTVASAYELASYHKPTWQNNGDDNRSWF